jgi:hypothetical protein
MPVHAERLREMGKWLAVHGDSVYGTQAGIIPPAPDGSPVKLTATEENFVLTIPPPQRDMMDTVIQLER